MTDLEKAYKDFDTKIWITKGARFNAYRRLTRKQNASIFSISLLTLYVLMLEFVPANSFSPELKSYISILASVFILILSLLEARKSYEVKAERLHNSAMALNELYSRWELATEDKIKKELIAEYHELIKNCPENHEPCDDLLFRAQHSHEAKFKICKCSVLWIRVRNFVETYWLYIALVLSPGLLLFVPSIDSLISSH